MSQRERWIIYPLLFLTFCLAIRDQWPLAKTSTGTFNALLCRSLTVLDENGDQAVFIGSRIATGSEQGQQGSGQIKIFAREPGDVGGAKSVAVLLTVSDDYRGVVQANGESGMQLVELSGNSAGGYLAFHNEKTGQPFYLHVTSLRPSNTGGGVILSPPNPAPPRNEKDPRAALPRPPTPPSEDDADSA